MRKEKEKIDFHDRLIAMNLRKTTGIYMLIINGQFYIGSSVDLFKRLSQHINHLLRNVHHNIRLQRLFNKYKDISFEILEYVLIPETITNREQYFINKLKPELNLCPVAGSRLGIKVSAETLKKMSEAMKGRVMSAETRKRMGDYHRGRKLSPEHCRKLALAKTGANNALYQVTGKDHPLYGRKRPAELVAKMSGQNCRTARSGEIIDTLNNSVVTFKCLRTICKELGLVYSTVKNRANDGMLYRHRYRIIYSEKQNIN